MRGLGAKTATWWLAAGLIPWLCGAPSAVCLADEGQPAGAAAPAAASLELRAGQAAYVALRGPWWVTVGGGSATVLEPGELWTSRDRGLAGAQVRISTGLSVRGKAPGELAVYVPAFSGSYRLLVAGRAVGACGDVEERFPTDICPARTYRLPAGLVPGDGRPVTVELESRAVPDPGLLQVTAGPRGPLWLGTEGAVAALGAGAVASAKVGEALDFSLAAVCVLGGLVALLLLGGRGRQYGWFAGLMLVDGLIYGDAVWEALCPAPGWMLPVRDVLNDLYVPLLVLLVRALLAVRADLFYRVALWAAGAVLLLDVARVPLGALTWQEASTWAEAGVFGLSATWLLWRLARCARRGEGEARLLLLPLGLVLAGGLFSYMRNVLLLMGNDAPWLDNDLLLLREPFPVYLGTLSEALLPLTMLAGVLRHYNRSYREEERYRAEYAAAREVQEMLLPEPLTRLPGFAVEAEYRPAQVVGGDFYQLLPDGAGGLLLVLGDVAGKGLPAAMLVAMIVGAVRTLAAGGACPQELMMSINERLLGRAEGFSTCLVAHLTANGELAVVNAGHLPPYWNGRELALEGSLPLGVVRVESYGETAAKLHPGDRLTFVTDGVVEAMNRRRELFGFARVEALSRASAAELVRAAQEWGQNDDLTVVTVEYLGTDGLRAPLFAGARQSPGVG